MARANELKIENRVKPAQAKPIFVRTVYGNMLDLLTNTWYTQAPKEVIRITPWMQSQIDAKKMEVV
jgi:hypothetical protein